MQNQLESHFPGVVCTLVPVSTRGDRTQAEGKPLPEIGGKGLFTAELEDALKAAEIDCAVHSLKDLPTSFEACFVIGAYSSRAPVEDVLVSRHGSLLKDLPAGALVGTSSLRRSVQLLALRPDLRATSVRGNVNTRIEKAQRGAEGLDAVLLARAGVERLGLTEHVSQILSIDEMVPAPGQGVMAVECRADDSDLREMLDAVNCREAECAVRAERSFLAALEAGCSMPVGCYAQLRDGGATLFVRGFAAAADGSGAVRLDHEGESKDPEAVGREMAAKVLAMRGRL